MGTIDKRKAPRIIVDYVSVEVYLHQSQEMHADILEICQVRNISESGMMFEAEAEFEPGTAVRLTFALPDSPIVIRTDAIIIHSEKKKVFETGVQFNRLAMAEQKLLQHLIAKGIAKAAR